MGTLRIEPAATARINAKLWGAPDFSSLKYSDFPDTPISYYSHLKAYPLFRVDWLGPRADLDICLDLELRVGPYGDHWAVLSNDNNDLDIPGAVIFELEGRFRSFDEAVLASVARTFRLLMETHGFCEPDIWHSNAGSLIPLDLAMEIWELESSRLFG